MPKQEVFESFVIDQCILFLQPLGVAAVFNPEDLYVRAASPGTEAGAASNSLRSDNDESEAQSVEASGIGGVRDMVGGGGDGHETWIQVRPFFQVCFLLWPFFRTCSSSCTLLA